MYVKHKAVVTVTRVHTFCLSWLRNTMGRWNLTMMGN